MAPLSRREFVLGAGASSLGLLAGCGRLPWQGGSATTPATPIRQLGLLSSPESPYEADFRQALGGLGYVQGQNLILEARYEKERAAGTDEFRELAEELVRLPVDAIATIGIRATY